MKYSVSKSVVWLMVCWAGLFARADHLSRKETAVGKSDSILSGVDVNRTTIKQAIAELGQPHKVAYLPQTFNQSGGVSYDWNIGDTKIELGTEEDKGNSIAYSVDVWGIKPIGKLGRTGRGLALGDTLAQVRKIYGGRFSLTKTSDGKNYVIIQWNDETTLYLDFSAKGRINHMHLLASTE